MKILVMLILCLNILFSQEENQNVVKTSELELFLFKVGFESLLKDVDSTKNKSEINEEELKKLSSKVELIMNEVYKEKRVLNADNNSTVVINSSDKQEIELLKKEIELLKLQMQEFSNNKITMKNEEEKKEIKEKQIEDIIITKTLENQTRKIAVDSSNIRSKPNTQAEIVEVLAIDTVIEIESCDKYDWCKLKDEEKYISKFLLN